MSTESWAWVSFLFLYWQAGHWAGFKFQLH